MMKGVCLSFFPVFISLFLTLHFILALRMHTNITIYVTITVAVPVMSSAVALTKVVPGYRAVKKPVSFTVPTVILLLPHTNVTSDIVAWYWSKAVAINC